MASEESIDLALLGPPLKIGQLNQTNLNLIEQQPTLKDYFTNKTGDVSVDLAASQTSKQCASGNNLVLSINYSDSVSQFSSALTTNLKKSPSSNNVTTSGQTSTSSPHGNLLPDYDVGRFLEEKATDVEKTFMLKNTWQAQPGFQWPFSLKKQGSNTYKRHLLQQHLNRFPDFAFSESCEGILCKFCVLTGREEATYRTNVHLGNLVTKPLQRYDRLSGTTGDLNKHLQTEYHKRSKDICYAFIDNQANSSNVYKLMNSHHRQICEENRKRLRPIIETVVLCGQNNIALRGCEDSGPINLDVLEKGEGNFKRLLKFRVHAGDLNLKDQIVNAPQNACYTSGDIQNQIIDCVGVELRDKVVARVKKAGFFVVMADETTDISSTEQLAVCFRYYDKDSKAIREDFVEFLDVLEKAYGSETSQESEVREESIPNTMEEFLQSCEENNQRSFEIEEPRLTGEVIGNAIVDVVKRCSLSMEAVVGQSYDGASVMSSTAVGTCSYVKQYCQYADYYHCSAHALNLTLVHASKIPVVRNMIGTVKAITTFLSTSNKKKIVLASVLQQSSSHTNGGRLQSLCETRWVERVTALEKFVANYVHIVRTLMAISRWQDHEAKGKAMSLFKAITDSTFIITLFCCVATTTNIDVLSKTLQQESTCLQNAMGHVQDIIATLEDDRSNSEQRFKKIMQWVKDTVACLKIEIVPPRVCNRSTQRANPNVTSPLDYFRVTVYIPFLDMVLQQLKFRFNEKSKFAGLFDILLPSKCYNDDAMEEQFEQLWSTYSSLLHANNVQPEDIRGMNALAQYRQWVMKWKREFSEKSPADHTTTMQHCNVYVYPTIHALLTIASILPVSTATVERSFSSLRLLKTYLRNRTSGERLNGLTMMYIYGDEEIDIDRIIERFASAKKRRLLLL